MATAALLLAGCLDLEQEYWLNPDGSGKVAVRWVGPARLDLNFTGAEKKAVDPEAELKKVVGGELGKAKGVDCWKDVSYKLRQDGKLEFRATAYFRDISALKLHFQGSELTLAGLKVSKNEGGHLVIGLEIAATPKEGESKPATKEDIEAKMLTSRFQYQQFRPLLKVMFDETRIRTTIQLPGEVATVEAFQKTGTRGVTISYEGRKIMEAFDQAMADDEFVKKALFEDGTLQPGKQHDFWRAWFAAKGPPRVQTTGPLRPTFDYDAEATPELRKASEALLATFAPPPPPPPPVIVPVAPEPFAPQKDFTTLMQEDFIFDLGADEWLRIPRIAQNDFTQNLTRVLGSEGFDYSVNTPGNNSSGSMGGKKGHFRLSTGDAGITSLDIQVLGAGGRRITLNRDPNLGRSWLLLQDGTRGITALLTHARSSAQVILPDKAWVKSWATLKEAFRAEPVLLGEALAPLRALPFPAAPTAADPDVIDAALRWHEELPATDRSRIDDLAKALDADDLSARNKAESELQNFILGAPHRLRRVLALHEKAASPEVRARLHTVLSHRPRTAQLLELVAKEGLHRDLGYLGALLESDRAGEARARLTAMVGRTFPDRPAFDAWHAENRKRLTWDEAAGRYRGGE